MAIDVTCPNCGKTGNVPDTVAGKSVHCPRCQSRFVVRRPDHAATAGVTDKLRSAGSAKPDSASGYDLESVDLESLKRPAVPNWETQKTPRPAPVDLKSPKTPPPTHAQSVSANVRFKVEIGQLVSLEAKIRQYLKFSGLAGPDGDVHPGICSNISEAINALRTGKVPAARVASGLKKMAEYAETIGITRGDSLLSTYLFDLKIIAGGILMHDEKK